MPETTHDHGRPQALAPHVEPGWTEAFVVEQRILGVPGDRIGDALLTVETHVADSGESALEAFGDARAYAAELATPAPAGRAGGGVDRATVAGSVLGLLAIVTVPRALGAALQGADVAVTAGDLVVVGIVAALCAGLFLASGPVLRLLAERRWAAVAGVVLIVAVFVAALVLLPAVVVSVPAAVMGAVGLAAMVAEVALLWRLPADAVVTPGSEAPARRSSPLHALALGPGLVGVMCLLTWVTHLAS